MEIFIVIVEFFMFSNSHTVYMREVHVAVACSLFTIFRFEIIEHKQQFHGNELSTTHAARVINKSL